MLILPESVGVYAYAGDRDDGIHASQKHGSITPSTRNATGSKNLRFIIPIISVVSEQVSPQNSKGIGTKANEFVVTFAIVAFLIDRS
jgi:hypothetical protein